MKKYCVVTCIFNDYEFIREPLKTDLDCDYFLFTDNSDLKSDIWNIIYIKDFDTDELTGVQKTYKFKYSIYKYIPNLLDYDYIIRIDGSIALNESLAPIIDQMRNYDYDLSIGIHPFRNNRLNEYDAWVKERNLDNKFIDQYKYFVSDTMNGFLYDGLCENTVQIYKCNRHVYNFLDTCYNYINYYTNFEDGNDQCYFTDILSWFVNDLRINWHSNKLYIKGYYMTCYEHNSGTLREDEDLHENIMYNRPITINNF